MDDLNKVLAYGVPEACRVIGLGRTKLYALIADGKIEARQCGGRTLIPAGSLVAFLADLPPSGVRVKHGATGLQSAQTGYGRTRIARR